MLILVIPGGILLALVAFPTLDRGCRDRRGETWEWGGETSDLPGSSWGSGFEELVGALMRELSVVRREQWGASDPKFGELVRESGKSRITIHHSAIDSKPKFWQGFESIVRGVQKYHLVDRGWSDIGYHFLIDPEGEIYEGRYLEVRGSHAGSVAANTNNVGVCLLGNFEDKLPGSSQLDALSRLIELLERAFQIPRSRLTTHQEIRAEFDLGGTACPGKCLLTLIKSWREGPVPSSFPGFEEN